eukprot:10051468-Karenia_brevis.AAC.1
MNHGGTMDLPTIIPSQIPYGSTGRMSGPNDHSDDILSRCCYFSNIGCTVLNRSYSSVETH